MILKYCCLYISLKLDKWILTFEMDSVTFFNNSLPANVEYGELELRKTKPEDYENWNLKLLYQGYPGVQLPEIIWNQTSNPFENVEVQNFRLVRNSITRYLDEQYHFFDDFNYTHPNFPWNMNLEYFSFTSSETKPLANLKDFVLKMEEN